MPQRLVYSPKAYVYTKKADGTILDVSNYVTAGQVDRKISQVSTASVTLRNPQRRFTTPSQGVAFHPQDPITIYLERIANKPVRVFTGYLDETPYYQLYPGTITLNASCTLKRLLYSFFDPSLPYVIAFFEKYGWINTGSGSMISSQAFNSKMLNTQSAVNAGSQPFTNLQDGSLGKLLWAVLYNMGQWDDSNIYIEALPSGANGIAARMATLMQSLQQQQAQASAEFNTFLEAVVGTGSQGSGGGSGNTGATTLTGGSTTAKIWNFFVQKGLPPQGAAGIMGNWQQENNFSTGGSYGSFGLAQWSTSRHDSLVTYAKSQGGKDTDLDMQLGFCWLELNRDYQSTLQGLRTASTPQEAARVFCNNYEEPGAPDCMGYPVYLSKRMSYAAQFYRDYNNKSGSSGATTGKTTQMVAGPGGRAIAVSGTGSGQVLGSSGSGAAASGKMSRVQAMLNGAQAIANSHLPYAWGGGHGKVGTPSPGAASSNGGPTDTGFDCSGCVAAVLASAGAGVQMGGSVGSEVSLISSLKSQGLIMDGPGTGTPEVTLWDSPGVHIFMSINGRYFGTWDGGTQAPGGGGWMNDGHPATSTYNPYHFKMSYLNGQTTYTAPNVSGSSNGAPNAGTSSGGTTGGNTSAQAFTAEVNLPSVEDQVTALALGAEGKGLMHDQSLMPFIQQLTQASLRSFMSLPNGDFYAFYPDYFGEMGTKQPYWLIDDIEILDGGINLSDAGLATHVFAVGDNTWPVNNELMNMLFSAGTITVYNAFLGNMVDTKAGGSATHSNGKGQPAKGKKKGTSPATTNTDPGQNLSGNIMTADEAAKFVERYGARPLVQNYPMVRSAIYEMLLAYQQFMTAWSTQFNTPFTFTFMPEVFPGGKVAFPNHGLQMYVQEVVHQWNYAEGGFTTTATLSAPSVYGNSNPDLPPNMIDAMVEPLRSLPPGPTGNKSTSTNSGGSTTTTTWTPTGPGRIAPNP